MTILIEGRIDSDMVESVRADTSSRKVVVVSSGGSVASALEIRRLLMAREGGSKIREVEVRIADSAALFMLMAPFQISAHHETRFTAHLPSGFKDGREGEMPVVMVRLWDYLQAHYGWQDGYVLNARSLEMLTADKTLHKLVDAC